MKLLRILLYVLCLCSFCYPCTAQTTMYAVVWGNQKYFVGSSTQHSGLFRSNDSGRTWKHLGSDNQKSYSMDAVDSTGGRILYVAAGNGVHRSTDFGNTWKIVTDWRMTEVLDVKVDQNHPNYIYAASAFGFWLSKDGGNHWERPRKGLHDNYVYRLQYRQPDTIIALTSSSVEYSVDHGNKWHTIMLMPMPRAVLMVPGCVEMYGGDKAISINPLSSTFHLATPQQELPAFLSLACTNDTTFYYGSFSGVRSCKPDPEGTVMPGKEWTDITDNLPNKTIHALAPIGNTMYAGTFGNGVFRRENGSWVQSGLEGSQVWSLVVKQY